MLGDCQIAHGGRHLMRTRIRLRRPISQTSQTLRRVLTQPPMNRLTRHPEPASHRRHRFTIVDHFIHRGIPLFHKTQLHQHEDPPQPDNDNVVTSEEGSAQQVEISRGVTQLPEPLSPSYRNRVPELEQTNRSQHVHHDPGQHNGNTRLVPGLLPATPDSGLARGKNEKPLAW